MTGSCIIIKAFLINKSESFIGSLHTFRRWIQFKHFAVASLEYTQAGDVTERLEASKQAERQRPHDQRQQEHLVRYQKETRKFEP